MSNKVIYANLFDGFFVPGVGNFKNTLPADNHTLKDFSMHLGGNGMLILSWKDKANNEQSFGLGVSMIKSLQFAAERPAPLAAVGS